MATLASAGCASTSERPWRNCTFGLVAGAFGGGVAGSQIAGSDSEERILGAAAGAVALGAVGCAVERAIRKDRGETEADAGAPMREEVGEDGVARLTDEPPSGEPLAALQTNPRNGPAISLNEENQAPGTGPRLAEPAPAETPPSAALPAGPRIGSAIARVDPEQATPQTVGQPTSPRAVPDAERVELGQIRPIQFAFDSAALDEAAFATIRELTDLLKGAGDAILVIGHACSIGSEAYNLALSVRRADAVRDRFIAAGVSAERLIIEGEGEKAPLAGVDEADPRNRRVDFRLKI
jgi:outer membrane protein OmpA-like peptidoglycan-associated protein